MLPVVVTGKDGKFVDGLTKNDFVVRVEESRVDFDTFERDRRLPCPLRSWSTPRGAWGSEASSRTPRAPSAASSQPAARRRLRALRVLRGAGASRDRLLADPAELFARCGVWRLPDRRRSSTRSPRPRDDEGPKQQERDPPLHRRRRQRQQAVVHADGRAPPACLGAGLPDRDEGASFDLLKESEKQHLSSTPCRCWPVRAGAGCTWSGETRTCGRWPPRSPARFGNNIC